MSSPDILGISIGEEKTEAGEPLFCVIFKKPIGAVPIKTLKDLKWLIAEYERHRGGVDSVDMKIADAVAAYDRDVLPHRLSSFASDITARG